jgi:hypothetical protein
VPIIEIGADTRGLTTSLAQADRALDQTAKKADRAEKEVKEMGRSSQQAGANMSAAFAATGGGLAITHGLEGMASGFRSGNSAMAAFAASQALLDLGRFKEDMKGVTEATGGATSVFGKLGAIMKAHPLMTIATVLAGAASVMAMFGSNTEQAADRMERLGEAMKQAEASQYSQRLLGLSQDPGVRMRQAAVHTAGTKLGTGEIRTFDELAAALGTTTADLQARVRSGMPGGTLNLPSRFNPATQQFMQMGAVGVTEKVAQFLLRQFYAEIGKEARSPSTQAAAQTAAAAAMGPVLPPGGRASLYADPSLLPNLSEPPPPAPPVTVALPPGVSPGQAVPDAPLQYPTIGSAMFPGQYQPGYMATGPQPGGQVFSPAMAEQAAMIQEQQDQAKANMDQLIAQGEQFGAVIGDAFFRVAEGTMTAKQALAELVRMFAQMAAQQAFAGIGGAVAQSFAPTQAQTTANATPPAGGAGVGAL